MKFQKHWIVDGGVNVIRSEYPDWSEVFFLVFCVSKNGNLI